MISLTVLECFHVDISGSEGKNIQFKNYRTAFKAVQYRLKLKLPSEYRLQRVFSSVFPQCLLYFVYVKQSDCLYPEQTKLGAGAGSGSGKNHDIRGDRT